MRPRWCNRGLVFSPLYFTVCTTEEQFIAECRRMNVPAKDHPNFVNETAHATTTYLGCGDKRAAIVGIRHDPERPGVETVGLLVHEAVHIWQWIREHIGEDAPSAEFEAYAIQNISLQLMDEYMRQKQ